MSRPFSLLIKPAGADCNLRCRYCFYLPKAGLYPDSPRPRMDETTLDALVRGYMATPQPQYVFGWQGGEPTLMGLDFFKRVTDLQGHYGGRGVQVANGLQTNGTALDDALAAHFAAYRFLLGVSLDGPADLHDRFRLTIGGAPTHARVWDGIATLRRNQVEFNILTLVSQANVRDGARVYRYLRDEGFLHHQYIECVEFDAAGAPQPYAITGAEWGRFLCDVFDAWVAADTRRVSVRVFDSIVGRLVDGNPRVCQMGTDCRDYLVVEHNGDLYPCDFYVERDRRLGNVREPGWPRVVESPEFAAFGARKRDWPAACRACEYLPLCAGDCPKNRLPTGTDGVRLSAMCAGWRMFYAHALPELKRLAAEVAREIRPPVAPAANAIAPPASRRAPCPCGSGRPYKRCHGKT